MTSLPRKGFSEGLLPGCPGGGSAASVFSEYSGSLRHALLPRLRLVLGLTPGSGRRPRGAQVLGPPCTAEPPAAGHPDGLLGSPAQAAGVRETRGLFLETQRAHPGDILNFTLPKVSVTSQILGQLSFAAEKPVAMLGLIIYSCMYLHLLHTYIRSNILS